MLTNLRHGFFPTGAWLYREMMLESQEVTEARQQLMICDLPPTLLVSDNLMPQELEHQEVAR